MLGHPLVGWGLFGGGLVLLYLTPALDLAQRNDLAHGAMHAHVVLAGVLFLAPLVGVDALPHRPPHPARLLAVLAAVPFHAVVAVALLSATSPMAPDAYPSLDDQRVAAAIFWGAGELLTPHGRRHRGPPVVGGRPPGRRPRRPPRRPRRHLSLAPAAVPRTERGR